MRVIIAGSRSITDYQLVHDAIKASGFNVTCIVSGTARGVDRLGEEYAKHHALICDRFPADWNAYGKRAGYLRNERMAAHADALVAIWDGESRGTKHMIEIAKRVGLSVYIHHVGPAGEEVGK